MRERVLITGGCGFVGTNLIACLQKERDYAVRVLDNESLGRREYLADFPQVTFQCGDLRDPEAVRAAIQGVDCVVHLAADTRVMDSIDDPVRNYAVNVRGTFNLLQAMRELGVSRIVNASTGGAILGEALPPVHEEMVPKPASPYGASKLAVEGYLSAFAQSYGFQSISLRFSNVYGPRSWHKGSVVAQFFKNILSSEPLTVFGDGSQKRDYVHVEDVCRSILLALEKENSGVFQIGTGVPTSINELIALMGDVVGEKYLPKVTYDRFRPGEIRDTWSDISKARRELGFEPSKGLQDGLGGTWDWFLGSWRKA